MILKCAKFIIFYIILGVSTYISVTKAENASSPAVKGVQNTLDNRLLLNENQITQGSLVIGKLKPGYKISYKDKLLPLTENNEFVFGVGRDEVGKVVLETFKRVSNKDSSLKQHQFDIKKRNWKIERIDGLPQSKVNPKSPQLLSRIKEESKLVKNARSQKSTLTHFLTPFKKPASGRISGVYGSQRILNGEKKRPHYGQDIANKVGTPVYAPAAGIVTLAESDLFFSGGTIIIDHGYQVNTTYLHLSKLNVKVGQTLGQGEKIGEIGATGRATGPHLDWRLNWNNTRLDPALLIQD